MRMARVKAAHKGLALHEGRGGNTGEARVEESALHHQTRAPMEPYRAPIGTGWDTE